MKGFAYVYDLAVWVGPRPHPEAADAEFERRMDAMEAHLDEETAPQAAAELVAFVEAATARFPESGPSSSAESPWASKPLIGDIVGDLIYFPLTFSGAEYARDGLAELADSLGLVCYDPQVEALLPDPDATSASQIAKRAASAFQGYIEQQARDA